jgi:hypothetical protein
MPKIDVTGSASVTFADISAGVVYSPEDREILSRLESISDQVEALSLRSELDRLKDVATPTDDRRTAVQKLKSFLYRSAKYLGKKVDDIGTAALIAYLERQIPSVNPGVHK